MNTRIAALMMALTLLMATLVSQSANAFCIYNATSSPVEVNQLYHSKGMVKTISAEAVPGALLRQWLPNTPLPSQVNATPVPGKECCNWKNAECNRSRKPDAPLNTAMRVTVKQGVNVGVGRTGGESYTCGQLDAGENTSVTHNADGWVMVEPNPKWNSVKNTDWRNPKFLAKVFQANGQHTKTFPCPAAVRTATWTDLIPDWSDVIAG